MLDIIVVEDNKEIGKLLLISYRKNTIQSVLSIREKRRLHYLNDMEPN